MSILNNLHSLAVASDEVGMLAGKARVLGIQALNPRDLSQLAKEDAAFFERLLRRRSDLLESIKGDLANWENEVRKGKEQVDKAFRIADTGILKTLSQRQCSQPPLSTSEGHWITHI